MTTIYLIRHAQAEGNLTRRMHGHYNSNLTALGLRQLADLQKRFETIHVDACYSSDLIRAQNTALAVCLPNGLENRIDPGFREVGVGIWEDIPFGYLNTFHGQKMVQFSRDQRNWTVKGSETYSQYTRRFLQSMELAIRRHVGGTIAIVSHSIVMRAVLRELFPQMQAPHSANTAVTRLEYENGQFRIVYVNDSSHLNQERDTPSKLKWWQQPGAQGDDTFWYREGWTDVGLEDAPRSPIVYTVLEDQHPVGLICLSEEDADTGRIDYVGLVPSYRGYDLSVQLVGQGISVMRKLGKKRLFVRSSLSGYGSALQRKLPFVSGDDQDLILDLVPQVRTI